MARKTRSAEQTRGQQRYQIDKNLRHEYRDYGNHTCDRCGITQAEFNADNNPSCSHCQAVEYQSSIGASMCRKCRHSKGHHVLQLHHRIPQSVAQKHKLDPKLVTSPENVTLLCPTCHAAFHDEWDDLLRSSKFISAIKKGYSPQEAREIAFASLR